jgi:hypothetical protein
MELLEGHRDGETYEEDFDFDRLNAQAKRVYLVMKDSEWRTLSEISFHTGDPEASISARLRDLRKARFGSFTVERRRRTENGLYEYRVLTPLSVVESLNRLF